MIRVGIVGLGFMAATHIKAYRQVRNASVIAICNPSGRHLDGDFSDISGNLGSRRPIKLNMRKITAYRDFQEMLTNPAVDLIDICAPTHAHPELAIAALKARKHVLCEKPLARTSHLAAAIAQAAAAARTFLMPAMCLRFWPEWVWLKQAIDQKAFGRVESARFRRVAEPPGWGKKFFLDGALSGGALLDLHIHDTDFVQFCFGRPAAVYSTGFSKISGAIDHVVTQYQFQGGPTVQAEGSWSMTPGFGFHMSYTVSFETATADYDMARGKNALRLFQKGKKPRTIRCRGPNGYLGEIRHILEAIRLAKPPRVVTAAEAVRAIEICEAEERSVQTGQIIPLNPVNF